MFRAKNAPDAILSYYLKTAVYGAVKLQVADVSGAVVRELDGARGAGIHRVAWNLRTAQGERVASGSYVVRLSAGGGTMVAPLDVRGDPNREK
jgi:flagellar hook assembly protein FlgD